MKQKEIYEFIKDVVDSLQNKVASQENTTLPDINKEYTKGQLYEAGYILEIVERIIFKDD